MCSTCSTAVVLILTRFRTVPVTTYPLQLQIHHVQSLVVSAARHKACSVENRRNLAANRKTFSTLQL